MAALISRVGKKLRRIIQRPGSVELTRYEALLPAVEKLEPELEKLSDEELTERAGKLREKLKDTAFGDDQLVEELTSLKREAFNLRFQAATSQLEKPTRVKEVRRDIARIKTLQGERHRSSEK